MMAFLSLRPLGRSVVAQPLRDRMLVDARALQGQKDAAADPFPVVFENAITITIFLLFFHRVSVIVFLYQHMSATCFSFVLLHGMCISETSSLWTYLLLYMSTPSPFSLVFHKFPSCTVVFRLSCLVLHILHCLTGSS